MGVSACLRASERTGGQIFSLSRDLAASRIIGSLRSFEVRGVRVERMGYAENLPRRPERHCLEGCEAAAPLQQSTRANTYRECRTTFAASQGRMGAILTLRYYCSYTAVREQVMSGVKTNLE